MKYNKKTGIIVVILASFMWSLEPIFAKLSFRTTDVYNTFATRILFYLSITATLLADFIYTYALTKVYVINAVLIGHIQPIFIIILGYFLLKDDKLTFHDYLGILFMILSGILVTTKNFSNLKMLRFETLGDLLVFIATFLWSTTAIITRRYLKSFQRITFKNPFRSNKIIFFLYPVPR